MNVLFDQGTASGMRDAIIVSGRRGSLDMSVSVGVVTSIEEPAAAPSMVSATALGRSLQNHRG